MAWFSRFVGNATPLATDVARRRYEPLFVIDERIEAAFRGRPQRGRADRPPLPRDRRHGADGPGGALSRGPLRPHRRAFSVESAGPFDLDASLRLWVLP